MQRGVWQLLPPHNEPRFGEEQRNVVTAKIAGSCSIGLGKPHMATCAAESIDPAAPCPGCAKLGLDNFKASYAHHQ
jgi:hypothetical protein